MRRFGFDILCGEKASLQSIPHVLKNCKENFDFFEKKLVKMIRTSYNKVVVEERSFLDAERRSATIYKRHLW